MRAAVGRVGRSGVRLRLTEIGLRRRVGSALVFGRLGVGRAGDDFRVRARIRRLPVQRRNLDARFLADQLGHVRTPVCGVGLPCAGTQHGYPARPGCEGMQRGIRNGRQGVTLGTALVGGNACGVFGGLETAARRRLFGVAWRLPWGGLPQRCRPGFWGKVLPKIGSPTRKTCQKTGNHY